MAMSKTELQAKCKELGIELPTAKDKVSLITVIANHLEADETALTSFLADNGLMVQDGEIVKLKKTKKLGENTNTKAFYTIEVLKDPTLAQLSYNELVKYLEETKGIETTAAAVSWYYSWMKNKGMEPVARARKPKVEKAPVEAE
jgi:Icc-related predicted phosphoesterase